MARDPLLFDAERVLANVRGAETEDLLNRITAYRQGMEREAIEMIEGELRDRGVTDEQVAAHASGLEREAIYRPDGIAAPCSLCEAPAVAVGWGWYRLFRTVPIFPRRMYFCRGHAAR